MKFGNWTLKDSTIEWSGKGLDRFIIDRNTLLETMQLNESEETLYKWILLATQEDWIDEDDLYDLNFIFVFAAGAAGQTFDYEMFDRTVDFQYELLDDEDDEDEDDDD